MYSILICDDERDIVSALKIYLEAEGYAVRCSYSGGEALDVLEREEIHLVLLDIMMPGLDGIEALARIRGRSNVPVIFLTAKGEDTDKVLGLNLGADDYVTKPFSAEELLARIRVALRHTRMHPGSPSADTGRFTAGELTIDYDKHQVLIAGENCHLTQNEYRIVALLARCAGRVLTYDYILSELWGPQSKGGNQILRVNMANIRRKIEKNPAEPQYIFTEVGVGYRMVEGDC